MSNCPKVLIFSINLLFSLKLKLTVNLESSLTNHGAETDVPQSLATDDALNWIEGQLTVYLFSENGGPHS